MRLLIFFVACSAWAQYYPPGGGGGGSGTVTSVGIVGTSNQITVTGPSPITNAGSVTLSIPNNPTLPGTTTATVSGNASTATALASTPSKCSAGNYPLGIDASGNAQNCTAASGSGTVTVVSSGSLTSTALVTGGGTTTLQTPSATATMDASGNISTPGTITTGSGSGVAGTMSIPQGTLPPSFPSNSFSLYSPTSIGTAYQWRVPAADAAGAIVSSGAGTPGVLSIQAVASANTSSAIVARDGSGNFSAGTISAALTGNSSTTTALATARSIYGNNFDGTAALSQVIASTFGGTGNGFAKLSGPTTSEKTFTLPNASANILTDNAVVTVAQGGTGTASTLAGLVRGNASAMTAAELSGDISTSGSNVTAIGAGKVTNAMISSTAPQRIFTKTIIIGDPGAASPVLANDNDTPVAVDNDLGTDVTITAVACWADAGSPTVTPILTGGTGTSILTGALTCGTAGWAAGTVNGSPVLHTFSSGATCSSTPCSADVNITTAGGTAKYIVVKITGSY